MLIYLSIFNKGVINEAYLFPGYYFRNNEYLIDKDSCIVSYGSNCQINGIKIICKGIGNKIVFGNSLLLTDTNNTTIRIQGNNNKIIIGNKCTITNSSFFIRGNENKINISSKCSCMMTDFHIEQNCNTLEIGKFTTMHGRNGNHILFELDEGKSIIVDEDCMISNGIVFRNSDSHSILNINGNRINSAQDIHIGNHCWIGLKSIILKGTKIPDNTIIGAGSLCNKKFEENNTIIAGVPAKIVKSNVNWDRKFVK